MWHKDERERENRDEKKVKRLVADKIYVKLMNKIIN